MLTNAMRPMMRHKDDLLKINEQYKDPATLYEYQLIILTQKCMMKNAVYGTWEIALNGLSWLSDNGFNI